MSLVDYIKAFRNVYKEIQVQKKYNKQFLIPYLHELESRHGGNFSAEQKQKIINYYGLFITSFLCSSYKRLYGETLSIEERKRATLFGILTPVGDDLFDIDKLNHEAVNEITYRPQEYHATTFSAKVAKEIQSFLLGNVPDKIAYVAAAENVLDIQIETAKQTSPVISKEELQRITYTKGAVSVIIYHQVLNKAATQQMQDVLFAIGSLYQLGNDIFDLYKDVRDNIYTLINTCENFSPLRTNFMNMVKLQNDKIMGLPYHKKNKKAFCIVMNTINARSIVAIEQFVKKQKKMNNEQINWWQLGRKDMIVDMEKPYNFLRWFYYIYKLPKIVSGTVL